MRETQVPANAATMPAARPPGAAAPDAAAREASAGPLRAGWRDGLAIVNLRGDPADAAFRASVRAALGTSLPDRPGGIVDGPTLRIVEAGPDDWFVIGPPGEAGTLAAALRRELAGQHAAITDVSGGYTVLRLAGASVRDVLAHGCPLDLHPRAFGPGRCAGSHFFKASVWLWQAEDGPVFELLVRRSFMDYAWLMLERSTRECGLAAGAD